MSSSHLEWVHPNAQIGDVYLLPRCSMPVTLRMKANSEFRRIAGHAYVDGAMNNAIWAGGHSAGGSPDHLTIIYCTEQQSFLF